jgi:hypothetical protein
MAKCTGLILCCSLLACGSSGDTGGNPDSGDPTDGFHGGGSGSMSGTVAGQALSFSGDGIASFSADATTRSLTLLFGGGSVQCPGSDITSGSRALRVVVYRTLLGTSGTVPAIGPGQYRFERTVVTNYSETGDAIVESCGGGGIGTLGHAQGGAGGTLTLTEVSDTAVKGSIDTALDSVNRDRLSGSFAVSGICPAVLYCR